ncbi:MAG: DNA-3-methyladenine glycosylase [Oscillospiraceae bacterium]
MKRLGKEFFHRDALEVAPELVGKYLVSNINGEEKRIQITETEAYCGEQDTACHAHKGRTPRTEVLYGESGIIYVYLCYGMHWLMNVITGEAGTPQGVLIRAGKGYNGPAKLTKALGITGEQNKKHIYSCDEVWIEDDGMPHSFHTDVRVGINYATEEYINKQWRFILD